ncbi:hypothetical protein B0H15DRAFT_954620 [Mycena belliarum]|uniref:Uncharacterized protein n=1 Tax=Mycena belliarum TaxID=1033014 RepID=A0AAD6TT05_9AGAR|nr:hypothetical protein B0H15DRAFT_954620 [Mycena belliae]
MKMTDPTTSAATPDEELSALVMQISSLSKLALDMTKVCIDVKDKLPHVIAAQAAKIAMAIPETGETVSTPWFEFLDAPTPEEMAARYPSTNGDGQNYHVVCAGRRPGLYADPDDATAQVTGVPNYVREKRKGRFEALRFYKAVYREGRAFTAIDVIVSDDDDE